jgi:hypothetical protein
MGVPLKQATASLENAVKTLFEDPTVRSVGIGKHDQSFGFFAVRNSAAILPLAAPIPAKAKAVAQIPVVFRDTPNEVEPHVKVPFAGPAAPGAASLVIEQKLFRPLCAGLQIQNFDDDIRTKTIAGGHIIIGTLGCFVRLTGGKGALLSNNHVVAGENRGKKAKDRILQQGAGAFSKSLHVATLTNFVKINSSSPGASVIAGTAILNVVDAGVAEIQTSIKFGQGYHPTRALPKPTGTASAKLGDKVFKVGRTTGLTHGVIVSIATTVGPVPYADGPSWFSRSLVIEGVNGTMFSDHGDSGSAIVRASGEIVGLLYAGNGQQTYACPIEEVFKALQCALF